MTETKPAEQSLLKREPVAVEYVPYGAQDKLKLTVAMVQNLIAVKTKSGKTCSDRDAIRFIAMCQAKRMNPFEGDCFLIGYDGKDGPSFALVTAHQTYLKRAELHPEFDGMKSGVIVRQDGKLLDLEGDFHDEGQQVVGGWATVFFKTRKQPMHKRLRLSRFQKPFGVWQEDPGGMICKCFDEQTEVLTDRGFERFANAEGHILQVTQTGLERTDAVPFFQKYSGEMISFQSRNGNFCVTPNHDLPLEINGEREEKVEARHLLDVRQRDEVFMPLCPVFDKPDCAIEDRFLLLAAAYLSDGSDNSASSGFSIAVSRPRKIAALRALELHRSESEKPDGGTVAIASSGREIQTLANKRVFYYSRSPELDWIASRGKIINSEALLCLSPRQARLFIDAWRDYDGQRLSNLRVGRIYTSRPDHCAAIELAANIAGLSVSERKARQSDIGGTNWSLILTNRSSARLTKSRIVSEVNTGHGVWCVTVPSGKIVVRRHGFSAVCHQCAEADSLRSAFPTMLGGLYLREEVEIDANKKDFSKPLFNGTQPAMIVDAKFTEAADKPAEETSEAKVQPEPETPAEDDKKSPSPEDKPKEGKRSETFNPLKAVRSLGKMSKVTDAQILAALAAQGTIDGSQATLEEVALAPMGLHILTALAEDWAEFVAAIKSRKEKE